jgi:hypothetical protein
MSKQLEKALSIIKDRQLERSLSLVVGAYLIGLGFYFIWCFYFYSDRLDRGNYLIAVVAGVIVITAVYFIFYLFILHIKSLQKVWPSFFLVSLISLLVLFFIPSVNSKIYYKFNDIELKLNQDKPLKFIDKNEPERKILTTNKKEIKKQIEDVKKKEHTEQKRMEVIKSKSNNSHEINDVANTSITELQAKLKFEHKENDKLRKELNETVRNLRFKDDIILALRSKIKKERKPEEKIVEIEKSNRNSSEIKINSKADNTDLDSLGQEIIFKVQIISSDTLISINSPKLMGLKNVWVYKDGDLYKYTVGKGKDLKSAYFLQSELRKKGFVGAFVVAFKNGKRIPVRDARKLLN